MKIFSIRNMLGAAAAYGAYKYAKGHGGFRQAFDEIVGKVREAAQQREGSMESSLGSDLSRASGSEIGGERGELGNVSEVTVSEVTSGYTPEGDSGLGGGYEPGRR